MAKKKKNTQSQKAFKPEDYIRTKVRQLPIYKCYKGVNTFEDREMAVVVIRRHPQGTFTLGAYMLDLWCLGIKDSFYEFSTDSWGVKDTLKRFKDSIPDFGEVSYTEAHNWIYGAHDFAADAGIEPCKEFAITKYILEPDDDNIELIEYDFGKNGTGEYCLVAKNELEASKYIPTLDKNIGKGKYGIEIGLFAGDDSFDDDFDYDEDEPNWKCQAKEIEYTYKGGDYPAVITLKHEEVFHFLTKEMNEIKDEEIQSMLQLPADSLRNDLHNIILWQLGIQWQADYKELEDKDECNWFVIPNALMLLTAVGNVEETLPVVIEIMRQRYDFAEYNFGDICDIFLWPILCKLCKDNPRLLMPYLLEPGLSERFKNTVLEILKNIGCCCEDVRAEMISMVIELLEAYKKDLPDSTICNGTVAAFTVSIAMNMEAKECIPAIKEIYATGLVDTIVCGDLQDVLHEFDFPWRGSHNLPPMDPIGVRNEYLSFLNQRDI